MTTTSARISSNRTAKLKGAKRGAGSADGQAAPRAAIYARISNSPDGQTLGIERQVEDAQALCDRNGWDVVEVFADNDVSAMKKDLQDRPAGRRLVAAIEAGEVDVLVAWATDRIYRRVDELAFLVELFDGILVETVTSGEVDLTTADGRLVARLLGSAAQHYSEKNAERIARKNLQLAMAGAPRKSSRRMFGYTDDRMALVEEEAEIVRWLYDSLLSGMPIHRLARAWQEKVDVLEDSAIRSATPWRMRGTLKNPLYAGLRAYRGEIVAKSQSPAVVDEETWRRAVAILDDPSRKSVGRGPVGELLITKVAKCSECGNGRISGGYKKYYATKADEAAKRDPRKRPMYRCVDCGRTARSRTLVDEAMGSLMVAFVEQNRAAIMPVADPGSDSTANARLLAMIERKRLDLQELDELLSRGEIRAVDYGRMTVRLREEIETLDAKLARSTNRYPAATRLARHENVAEAWEALTARQRRDIVNELVERIDFGKAGRASAARTMANIVVHWKDALSADATA